MTSLNYIDRVFTENTGGGSMVDFVQLKDGRILGINDECVVLFESIDDFYDGLDIDRQAIELKG